MNRRRNRLLYVGYGIALAAVFLYVCFPSDKMMDYLALRVHQIDPQLTLSLEAMKPTLPFGIRISGASLSTGGNEVVVIDRIRIGPRLLSLAGDTATYHFEGETLDGVFAGRADLGKNADDSRIDIEAEFSGLDIDSIPILKTLSDRKITGRLDANVVYTGRGAVGTTHVSATLADGILELLMPVPGLEDIAFQTIKTELVLNQGRINVKGCAIESSSLEGNLAGTIRLKKPIGESTLALKGRIKPRPELVSMLKQNLPKVLLPKRLLGKNGFPVTLNGTFAHPGFLLR